MALWTAATGWGIPWPSREAFPGAQTPEWGQARPPRARAVWAVLVLVQVGSPPSRRRAWISAAGLGGRLRPSAGPRRGRARLQMRAAAAATAALSALTQVRHHAPPVPAARRSARRHTHPLQATRAGPRRLACPRTLPRALPQQAAAWWSARTRPLPQAARRQRPRWPWRARLSPTLRGLPRCRWRLCTCQRPRWSQLARATAAGAARAGPTARRWEACGHPHGLAGTRWTAHACACVSSSNETLMMMRCWVYPISLSACAL